MKGPPGTVLASLAPGWAALRDGRWAAARTAFVTALETEETPEAYDGLSWAAWWLDDAETVFDARERAFRLYRERGAPASAARMATWLAADQLEFRGAFAVANGWLRRARRLLDPLEAGPDHGWLAFHEGYIAYVQGDTARTVELAVRAAALGRRFGAPDLEFLGLALQGAVLVACADVAEGMGCLDEAVAAALQGEAELPISRAWACCFLVSACEAVRDYPRVFEWCDRIAELAAGILSAAGGEHERARQLLEDAADGFERSGAPFDAAQARLELAASLVALGRGDAATREATACLGSLTALGAEAEARRARRLLDAPVGGDAPPPEVTRRERDVLRLLAEGRTNRQIAEHLIVSEHTVHRHVTNILRKLALPSRAAAAAHAVRSGLVDRAR